MKSKEISSKPLDRAKGGTTKMFSKMGVQPSQAGVAAPAKAPAFSKDRAKGGGSGKDGGQGGAAPVVAGQVSVGGRSGNNTFVAPGGKTKMFGKQTASRAQAGTSSPTNG